MTIKLPAAPEFGAPVTARPSAETLAFLATRRSSSALMLADPAPSEDELAMLLSLAVRVPDHGKLAPWRFVVLRGEGKAAFAARLEALAQGRGDSRAVAKLGKLKAPPLGVAVISSPKGADIPHWEQLNSAGAVATTLLYAAQALGYGANWITDWYAYDPEAAAVLGLAPGEKVTGFIFMGTPKEPPLERERPVPGDLVTVWSATA